MGSFEEIEAERRRLGLTRRAVYRRAGVDGETWRRTEKGITEPNVRTLRKLAEAVAALAGESGARPA
jgi:predicted transcriptional regulator